MNRKFKIAIKKNLWKHLCGLGHTLGVVGILNLLYAFLPWLWVFSASRHKSWL